MKPVWMVVLPHGQLTIAWLADLIGHMLLEVGKPVAPERMEGLVLIDELDRARLAPASSAPSEVACILRAVPPGLDGS